MTNTYRTILQGHTKIALITKNYLLLIAMDDFVWEVIITDEINLYSFCYLVLML